MDLYEQNGIGVVHVWCWAAWINKGIHTPVNEKGLRRFIDECHRRGLKVIPYVSTGYLDPADPAYREEWNSCTPPLRETYFNLERMCPGSPSWRHYFFNFVDRLLSDYGFDGLYWDGGFSIGCSNPKGDNHVHFAEYAPYKVDGIDHEQEAKYMKSWCRQETWDLCNEFMCEIYAKVKAKNGIVVAHIGSDNESPFLDKTWDYQLLGECCGNIKESAKKTRWYEPFILRFNDWSRLVTDFKNKDFTPRLDEVPEIEHYSMAATIPYMQFEWLEDGNLGEEEDIINLPSVKWKKEFDPWTEWYKAQKKAGFPGVLYASFIAGRDRYFEYLRVYREMTKGNTLSYLEIKSLENSPFPHSTENMKVSVFINDYLWVAIGNLNIKAEQVKIGPLQGEISPKTVELKPRKLTVLKYITIDSLPQIITFGNA